MMSDIQAVMPVIIVTIAAIVTMLFEAFRQPGEHAPIGGLGIIGLVGAIAASVILWDRNLVGFEVARADNFALFFNIIACTVGIVTILLSSGVIERFSVPQGEYYTLVLFAVVGMMLMSTANDLLVVFLSLEVMSLAVYVLTGIRRTDGAGVEASFKYFLLGAFSSAFFLYGVAFMYAIAGSTRLDRIGVVLAERGSDGNALVLLAAALLMIGFAFKVSAVPFHMWTPDAYEGAPTLVTGFMSTGVKAAAFAAFARVFLSALQPLHDVWAPALWVIAVATMVVGTVVGVAQNNVKRMLAYSSIAHAGYLIVGIIAANGVGKAGLLFYLAAYAVTNLGAFGIMALLSTEDRPYEELKDFNGLWQARPGLAALMTVFLLSLGGLPPTAGFVAKWYVFAAAVQEGYYWLAIIGVLSSVISVFYYLRVVVNMYMVEHRGDRVLPSMPAAAAAGLAIAIVGVFYMGILPSIFIDAATRSIETIF